MAAFTAKDPDDREAFDAHAGFTVIGREMSDANARNTEIDESVLCLG